MPKKTAKGFGELTELGKDFAKEVKKQVKEGTEIAVESVTGLNLRDNKDKEKSLKELKEIRKSDDKKRGPKIAEQRQLIAKMQAEERRTDQRKDEEQQRKIINLEEERRMRQAESGKMRPVKIPSGKKRASILPFREKTRPIAEDDFPPSVERLKRKAA